MEENNYWRELIESEIKIQEELKNLNDMVADIPQCRDLISEFINYYNETEDRFHRLELIEWLINTCDERVEDPYKQGLLKRTRCFYDIMTDKLSEQEIADGITNLYYVWTENPHVQEIMERLRSLSDKRNYKPRWYQLIERVKNFHGYHKSFVEKAKKNEAYFAGLQELCDQIDVDIDTLPGLSKEQSLKMIFKRLYNFAIRSSGAYRLFDESSSLYTNVFEACFLTSLCMFIHETKRIKGMTLRNFIYMNSPHGFFNKESPNYFDITGETRNDPDKRSKIASAMNLLEKEEITFRQQRYRILSNRTVYNEHTEWSSMRLSSEHEWAFQYVLNDIGENLAKTYRDFGNLYKVINAKLDSSKDEGYKERVAGGYKSFQNKLKKIKYEAYLALNKEILTHICKDKKYYGMNIYRLEKGLGLYSVTSEVNRLLECKDKEHECRTIEKSISLNGLHFPKVYQDFSSFDDSAYTVSCANIYYKLRDAVVGASRLVYDSLIDIGCLGEDWESLFLNTINDMTERVFYDPEKIDYTVTPESQEKFMELISAHVRAKILHSTLAHENRP